MSRISRTDYYFKVVEAVALRGTCDRGRSGAVLVKDGRIIATGYVGAPTGVDHCDEVGHEFIQQFDPVPLAGKVKVSQHCVKTSHAEVNALIQCARYGPSCDGSILYCTMFPCYDCAKSIVNAGVREVHSIFDYQKASRSKVLFDMVEIKWSIRENRLAQY